MQNNSRKVRVLALGDVCGVGALNHVCGEIRKLKQKYNADVVIVNGENASRSGGLDPDDAEKLLSAGADVITGGNHTLRGRGIGVYMEEHPEVLRPGNYPDVCPGNGYFVYTLKGNLRLLVLNVAGQLFMDPADSPFTFAERILNKEKFDFCVADFHGEATSEKAAFARYFDGRVGFTFGTHTHVQTADETFLSKGSAFITDIGMCGGADSIIGAVPETVIAKMVRRENHAFIRAEAPYIVCGAVATFDVQNGYVTELERIRYVK